MLAQFHAPKHATNQHLQAFYGLTSKSFEVIKMQTYDQPPSAKRAQIYLTGLLSLGAFLLYAVQNHLITDGFVYVMSCFFDSFNIKSSSSYADIALLILFLLALLGLIVLIRSFFPIFIFLVALTIAAAIFSPAGNTKPQEVKIKSSDKFENVLGG